MKKSVVSSKSIVPVMLAFFTMGFVDLVGIAANYVKQDFALSDTAANSFTVMVFFWFFVFSVPTGMLMNKIGRKEHCVVEHGSHFCRFAYSAFGL